MRVLLITDWNRLSGGAEAYITSLRDGLRAAGDDARLLTSSAGTAGDGTADFVAYGPEGTAAKALLQIVNPFAVSCVRRALAGMRPHAVVVNMFALHLSPAVLYALEGLPTVILVSDYKCVCPIGSKLLPDGSLCRVKAGWVCCRGGCVNALHWLRDQPRYALIREGFRRATRVLACSEWVRRELARDGIASEVALLPAPPPGPGFRRDPAPDPLFVFCGRLDREKGVELLLRAFARLRTGFPSARLRLVGRGPSQASLEQLASALGLGSAVEFCGWLSPPGVEKKLCDAWALVVPSIWAEPLGLVAVEAVVRGVPVIASASGGLAEVVEENVSGLLFPNNDEEALHGRLAEVASRTVFPDQTLPGEVVARALETFSIGRHAAFMRRVLSEATAGRASS